MPEADSTTEIRYRKVAGSAGYLIGNDGTVLSPWGKGCDSPTNEYKPLKWSLPKRGRYCVELKMEEGKRKTFYVHHLVLEAFVGPCPEGMECRHLDGNPANNHLSNLAWGTRQENHDDQIRHGTRVNGERIWAAKLTEDQVREIRVLRSQGLSVREISQRFGMAVRTIYGVAAGETWKHVV